MKTFTQREPIGQYYNTVSKSNVPCCGAGVSLLHSRLCASGGKKGSFTSWSGIEINWVELV